ncbi:MAG: hypothetical protein AAGB13_01715 [Cyanobacteria bacterium P01_F01_bin.33]
MPATLPDMLPVIDDLTRTQWQVADAIAIELVKSETDVNEFRKSIAYLQAYAAKEQAGKHFFKYLNTLAKNGRQIGHSKKTQEYFKSIAQVCQQYLEPYQDDAGIMLRILGWAGRLMQYYRNAGPIGEIAAPTVQSEREAEIQAINDAQTFQLDQTLDAVVTTIKGKKVTYEILGTIKLTVKEPKKVAVLTEGQTVTVRVTGLRDDGSLKNVKFVE